MTAASAASPAANRTGCTATHSSAGPPASNAEARSNHGDLQRELSAA